MSIKPIKKSITVPIPPKDAFDLFIRDINKWWPKDSHSISAGDGKTAKEITVDLKVGGKITETTHDGRRADWGTFTRISTGEALCYDWYVGRDPAEATQVEVQFLADAIGTRVDLTHSGFEVQGATGVQAAASYLTGWDMVLARYAKALVLA